MLALARSRPIMERMPICQAAFGPDLYSNGVPTVISSAERIDDFVIVDKMLGMYCGEASSNIADK